MRSTRLILAWFPRLSPALFAALLAVTPALAEVQLARVFSDHMVLQAQRPVPVWGTAAPGERILVAIAAQTKTTVAGPDGRWRVTLDPLDYTSGHTPQNLVVRATNEIRVTDVLIGEVWLSSGQSNMRYALGRLADATGRPNDPAPFVAEIAHSANPLIRLLNVSGGTPADQRWAVSGPTTTPGFSAITYFFARDLVRDRVYGEQIPHSGPLLRSSRVEGGKIILTFDHADGGLVLSQEKLVPLTVAGDDGRFVPASAEIDGFDRLVITRPPGSTDAKYVRYAWHDYFTPGLFNAYGLPASPFRTDDFPLTTAPAQR